MGPADDPLCYPLWRCLRAHRGRALQVLSLLVIFLIVLIMIIVAELRSKKVLNCMVRYIHMQKCLQKTCLLKVSIISIHAVYTAGTVYTIETADMVYIVDMVSTVEYGSQRSEQPQNVNFELIIRGRITIFHDWY